jgi:hypothetical protein
MLRFAKMIENEKLSKWIETANDDSLVGILFIGFSEQVFWQFITTRQTNVLFATLDKQFFERKVDIIERFAPEDS